VIRDSWFVVRGSWFVVRGSWFVVRGSWLIDCSATLVSGLRLKCQLLALCGTKNELNF